MTGYSAQDISSALRPNYVRRSVKKLKVILIMFQLLYPSNLELYNQLTHIAGDIYIYIYIYK